MRRREFMTLLGGAVVWPLAAWAQQPAMPGALGLRARSPATDAENVAAFHKGLSETGYVEGQNVSIKYRWAEGFYNKLPTLASELR